MPVRLLGFPRDRAQERWNIYNVASYGYKRNLRWRNFKFTKFPEMWIPVMWWLTIGQLEMQASTSADLGYEFVQLFKFFIFELRGGVESEKHGTWSDHTYGWNVPLLCWFNPLHSILPSGPCLQCYTLIVDWIGCQCSWWLHPVIWLKQLPRFEEPGCCAEVSRWSLHCVYCVLADIVDLHSWNKT